LEADKKICDKKFARRHPVGEASVKDIEVAKGMYEGSRIVLSTMADKAKKFYELAKGKAEADAVGFGNGMA